MAISTNFKKIQEEFNPQYWLSIDEYEAYYLQDLSERLADRNYYTDRNGVQKEIDAINHFPELKEYEVWMEGYSATGERASACFIGKVKARNFAQACHILMCKQKLESIEEENDPSNKSYVTPGRWDYEPNRLSVWGCKMYWSKELASKSFG